MQDTSYNPTSYSSGFAYVAPSEAISGSYDTYRQYKVTYRTRWGVTTDKTDSDVWIKCDTNGNLTDNNEPKLALMQNQVLVGDTIISFG